ncbi:hypothetical protein BX666DRAFT_1316606 [Dichotomocladium elegans]|nr:hypothetical protein BX666DRAFT_1316606 [Dichotomocladium elegans]
MGNIISRRRRLPTINQITYENHNSGDGRLSTGSSSKASELLLYPISEIEAKRLHNLHYLLKHIFQTSYFAPVGELLKRSGSYVLDMGCGHCTTWIIGKE